jgi:hypothetical protein
MAERNAARLKAEQELNDLRNKALMEIRKAEARANDGKPIIDRKELEHYKEGGQTTNVKGVLRRVDCLGEQARLHIATGKLITKILVPDPATIEIKGGGERSFACGPQKPARQVSVDYTPKEDRKLGPTGEAAKIEFR